MFFKNLEKILHSPLKKGYQHILGSLCLHPQFTPAFSPSSLICSLDCSAGTRYLSLSPVPAGCVQKSSYFISVLTMYVKHKEKSHSLQQLEPVNVGQILLIVQASCLAISKYFLSFKAWFLLAPFPSHL